MHGEPDLLANAYQSSLELAASLDCRTVAFPSISTGVYGYPVELAARVALTVIDAAIDERPEAFDEIRMVLFSRADLDRYEAVRRELSQATESRER